MDAAIIEKEALLLPEYDRALIADHLLQSISPLLYERKDAWEEEVENRIQAFEAGLILAVDGAEAMSNLRKQFPR